uniref:Uncharacterized protein n=1 Tax=viral metagenome TaxID=1070528 RepID=A0A6M3LC32_9ZZZZ
MVRLVIAAIVLLSCVGCGGKEMTVQDTLTVLERGKATGHLTITSSDHPLQFGMKQTFFLGPNITLAFDGQVDYSDPMMRGLEPEPVLVVPIE